MKNVKIVMFKKCLFIIALFLATQSYASDALKNSEQPNILFIIADDIGKELFGAYGNTYIRTPNFDKLAKQGMLFTNAFTTNGKCTPSRASIVSGRHFFQNREGAMHGFPFTIDYPSFPKVMEENGYAIGYSGKGSAGWKKNPLGKRYGSVCFAKGLPERAGFVFFPQLKESNQITREQYEGTQLRQVGPYTPEQMKELVLSGNVQNIDYSGNFNDFLENKEKGRPFFFWLGSNDAHQPWLRGSGQRFKGNLDQVVVPPFYPDNENMRMRLLDIAVEVELFDAAIGECIDILKKQGLYDNTIIVVTSDNGTEGQRSKGDTYLNNCNMPLVIFAPDRFRKGVIEDNICFSDFAPTFLELAGIDPVETMTGISFTDVLYGKKDRKKRKPMFHGRENYSGEFIYPARSIRIGNYYLIKNYHHNIKYANGRLYEPVEGDFHVTYVPYPHTILKAAIDAREKGERQYWDWCYEKRPLYELYDISKDPHCLMNLAPLPEYKELLEKMKRELTEFMKSENDPRELGDKDLIELWNTSGVKYINAAIGRFFGPNYK